MRDKGMAGEGGTLGVFRADEEFGSLSLSSSRSSSTTDAREELLCGLERRRLRFGVIGIALSSPPLVTSPSASFRRLSIWRNNIRLAAIRSPPDTVLFRFNALPGGGVGDPDMNFRSIGSPVSFDIAIARAAPALFDLKRPIPFDMSSRVGSMGVEGEVPG